jgi:hypothetical protein
MGCRDMRCIILRSGGNNMQYQTTAIVDDHPVGDSGMPRNTIYKNDSLLLWLLVTVQLLATCNATCSIKA